MLENNYLLIHEDGEIEVTKVNPDQFRDSVAAGIIEVIRVPKYTQRFETLEPDGSWKALTITGE